MRRALPGFGLVGGDQGCGGVKNVEVGFTLRRRSTAKTRFGKHRFSLGHVAAGLMLFNFVFDVKFLSVNGFFSEGKLASKSGSVSSVLHRGRQ